MEKQQDKKRMTHLEAWADFYTTFTNREIIPVRDRKQIGRKAVTAIPVAQADFLGKRVGRDGDVLRLGERRVAWILAAASAAWPNLFKYEQGWFVGG